MKPLYTATFSCKVNGPTLCKNFMSYSRTYFAWSWRMYRYMRHRTETELMQKQSAYYTKNSRYELISSSQQNHNLLLNSFVPKPTVFGVPTRQPIFNFHLKYNVVPLVPNKYCAFLLRIATRRAMYLKCPSGLSNSNHLTFAIALV